MKLVREYWMLLWLITAIILLCYNAGAAFLTLAEIDEVALNQSQSFRNDDPYQLEEVVNELDRNIENRSSPNSIFQILLSVVLVPFLTLMYFFQINWKKHASRQTAALKKKRFALQSSRNFLSHDIRGPICRIQGLLYLLNKEKDTDQTILLQKIKENIDEIDELTRNHFV